MPFDGEIKNGFVWNTSANAWLVARLDGTAASGGGGGGGSGDDLDTTPVAAIGATFAQPIPNWLAGAPIFDIPDDVVITPVHRGAWVHMQNDVGSVIFLPDDWLPGQAFGARQIGFGPVTWGFSGGALMQISATKLSHTGISEQFEEVIFRVITNVGGNAALWGVNGGTI
jgi:hypothetical protein